MIHGNSNSAGNGHGPSRDLPEPPSPTGQYPDPIWAEEGGAAPVECMVPAPAPEVSAARALTGEVLRRLSVAPAFQKLAPATQMGLLRDLGSIEQALSAPATARALETPQDLRRRLFGGGPAQPQPAEPAPLEPSAPGPKKAATETLAQRAGALIDEIDFPAFVAGLVHGTFDAIVDAAIRQMESFADLVSAVAKDVDTFTSENITYNQARDWLIEKHPADLEFAPGAPEPRLRPRVSNPDEEPPSPLWLADYQMQGEPLTEELIEEQLVPAARRRLGESRMQLLATMVLLGMNRVVVRDGSISARVRFRAAARDKAVVEYAVSQDPGGGGGWGTRGSGTYASHSTMISTLGVNAQTESQLQAELFGEVRIQFASETVPLDRFVDQARITLLHRHARASAWQQPGAAPAPAPPPATVPPAAPPPVSPASETSPTPAPPAT